MSTAVATQHKQSLLAKFAGKFSIEPDKLLSTLKATAFKVVEGPEVTNEQMAALLVVADQYGLNPFTRELFAFPDKRNGVVPVVSVDGWCRIVNEHPQCDGISFDQDDEKCTCSIWRKDRAHPTTITEYMSECKRGTAPWSSHPRRMLRHKALIQCARIAFGFSGIYDEDEARRIIDVQGEVIDVPEQSRTEQVKARLAARKAEQPSPEQAGNPPAATPPAEPPVSGHDEELATQP